MLSMHLKHIQQDLDRYSQMSRADLFSYCINDKLQLALKTYNNELRWNSEFLLTRGSVRVLKALTKLQKKADASVLEALANIESKLDEGSENE